jgi:hypothetical protein
MKSKANTNQDGWSNGSDRGLANFIALVEQVLSGHVEINPRRNTSRHSGVQHKVPAQPKQILIIVKL